MAHSCNSSILGKAERQEFKVIPCYRMSLRLDWDIWEPIFKERKKVSILSHSLDEYAHDLIVSGNEFTDILIYFTITLWFLNLISLI